MVDGGSPDDVIKSYAVAEAKSRGKQCNQSVGRTCWTLVMAKVQLLHGGVQLTGDTLSKPTPVPCSNTRRPGHRPSGSYLHQMSSRINNEPLVTARQCSRLSHVLGATLTPSCHHRVLVNSRSQMGFYSFPDYRSRVLSNFSFILLTGTLGVLTKRL